MLSALGYRVRIGTVYVISLDSGVGIHLKSRRHRIAHSTQRGPALPTEGPAPRGNMTMADTEKVASGIPGLDDLIEGGFWPKSTVVILGSSGTGKSTFAIQFLMEGLEQRELIGKLFYTLKELGVVLCTVEEHAKPGETIGEDVLLPIYLSDGAIQLEYYPIGGAFNRTVKLLKMRGVHHGEGVYPYLFARGVGIVVRSSPTHIPEEQSRSHVKTFDEAIKTAEAMKAPARVIERIRKMQKHWDYDYSPEEALQILFSSYGLKRGG